MPQNKLVHQDLLAAGLRQVTGCVSSWDLTEVISAFTFKRLLTSSRWNSAQTILDGLSSQKSHVSHMQRTFLVQRFFFFFSFLLSTVYITILVVKVGSNLLDPSIYFFSSFCLFW